MILVGQIPANCDGWLVKWLIHGLDKLTNNQEPAIRVTSNTRIIININPLALWTKQLEFSHDDIVNMLTEGRLKGIVEITKQAKQTIIFKPGTL